MSEVLRPTNKFQRGPQRRPSAGAVERFPDLMREREKAMASAGCCKRAEVLAKYDAIARERMARGLG